MKTYIYHKSFIEVSGDTAADVIQQLYEDTKRGVGPNPDGSELTKQQWWDYQRTVWKRKERTILPATLDAPGAAERFLQIMIEAEALYEGPKPTAPRGDALPWER